MATETPTRYMRSVTKRQSRLLPGPRSGWGGAMKVIACIEDPIVIKQILDHLKHKAETSGTRALPESRAPPAELLLGLFD